MVFFSGTLFSLEPAFDGVVVAWGNGSASITACGGTPKQVRFTQGGRVRWSCSGTTLIVHGQSQSSPFPTVYKQYCDPTCQYRLEFSLPFNYGMSTGSPTTADAANAGPMTVRVLDAADQEVGQVVLDPGESFDTAIVGDDIQLTALQGSVQVLLFGQSRTIAPGDGGVWFSPAAADGRLQGGGFVDHGGKRYEFTLKVQRPAPSTDPSRLQMQIGQGKLRDRFVATAIGAASFQGNAATFSGTGTWNGSPGYTFEARATDAGEPARGVDTFAITIRNAGGEIAALVDGKLGGGNVQLLRSR